MAAPNFNYELSEKQEMEYYEVPVVENRLVIVLDSLGHGERRAHPFVDAKSYPGTFRAGF